MNSCWKFTRWHRKKRVQNLIKQWVCCNIYKACNIYNDFKILLNCSALSFFSLLHFDMSAFWILFVIQYNTMQCKDTAFLYVLKLTTSFSFVLLKLSCDLLVLMGLLSSMQVYNYILQKLCRSNRQNDIKMLKEP